MTLEAHLIFVDVNANNNKFWDCYLYEDGRVVSFWGRVGDPPRETQLGSGEYLFRKKLAEKKKKGYTERETIDAGETKRNTVDDVRLATAAKAQIKYNSPEVATLVDYLLKKNIHKILSNTTITYNDGVFKTPLGVVTKQGLDNARIQLQVIGQCVKVGDYGDTLAKAISAYFRIVPKDFGRTKPNLQHLFPDTNSIQAQEDILDSLEASLQVVTSEQPKLEEGEIPNLFEAKLHLNNDLKIDTQKRFEETRLAVHYDSYGLKVKNVYEIEIASMKKAFDIRAAEIGNVERKWHGSRAGNLLSILKSGFIISSYAPNGRAFGNGIYFSSISTKSLNYAVDYNDSTAFMFLCDVALGKAYTPIGYDRDLPKPGYDSTWASPNKTSYIQNDELIVYKVNQINPVYLIEFAK